MKIKKIKLLLISILLVVQSINLYAADLSADEAETLREQFVLGIKSQLGKPYEYGAVGPDSFDCSGLIYYTARNYIDTKLPRTAKALYNDVRIVPDNKKEIGDILFFKTNNSTSVNHVGIYIGDNKFISALSDGDEQGVTISMLTNSYWIDRYVAVGQFLPSGKENKTAKTEVKEVADTKETDKKSKKTVSSSAVKDKTIITSGRKEGSIPDKIIIDGTVFFDWSLLSPRQFVFRYRGIDTLAHIRYAGWQLEPGLGIAYRYNYGLDTMQMPITLSITLNDFVRLYAGPVITFSTPTLIDTDKEIKASVFPGVVGISFTTPAYELGGFSIHGVQDVSYTVYNKPDGATLSFMDGLAAGLVMYTGVRVSFPVSVFGRGK